MGWSGFFLLWTSNPYILVGFGPETDVGVGIFVSGTAKTTMLSKPTIKRLQAILEKRVGRSVSFEEAAVAAEVYVGLYGVLLNEYGRKEL